MQSHIPKRIIQTGKHSDQPLLQRSVIANLKLLNPDFEYLFVDDEKVEAFIDVEFPQYRAVFDSFRFPIQRYDFFRYLAVYRLGGFYFDLDVLLAVGLSELLSSGCVFPFEGLTFSHLLRKKYEIDWEIGNYSFGSVAGHPFLKAIIDNCVKGQKDPDWVTPMMQGAPFLSRDQFYVLNSTGPGLITRTLVENPEVARTVSVLFPEDVCNPQTWNCFGHFGIHLMSGTWRPTTGFLRRKAAQYAEMWKFRSLLNESMKLGKTRRQVASGGRIAVESATTL